VKRRAALVGGTMTVLALVILLIVLLSPGSTPNTATPTAPTPTAPAGSATSPDRSPRDAESGLLLVEVGSLPVQARQTIGLIERGGPYPYAKDGAVFGNRERLLPSRPDGFYREYTVPTPAEDDRGPRRIATGDQNRQFFYTDDHYASFVRVRR
jgi:ribonuclease T1